MHVVAVAYSGGRDSTALLHAALAEAEHGGWQVVALHVHHGLSEFADGWLAHCAEQCREWADRGCPVEFLSSRLTERPTAGASVEAWARTARYAALAALARSAGAGVVLLGHHRRDQAETLLVQALRGGGTAGLSGMPQRVERDGLAWVRPWLRRSREEIDDYVRRHRLTHIDDDSNGDPRFARNRVRLDVWPALEAAFPRADARLAASARWAQEADAALAELAAIDLVTIAEGAQLGIAAWSLLSAPRRSLSLRVWLRERTGVPASAALIERLLRELPGRRDGRWPLPGGELRAHRGRLQAGPSRKDPDPTTRERELCVASAGTYALPGWGGRLTVASASEGGVPLSSLARLTLQPRVGGERFQAGRGRPPRSLKKQFQAAGLAAWERGGPLVYSGDVLVFVPGLGLDARALARPGQAGVVLAWERPGEGRGSVAG